MRTQDAETVTPSFVSEEVFTASVNIAICIAVAAWWLVWRRGNDVKIHMWRFRAYSFWASAWALWIVAWVLLLVDQVSSSSSAKCAALVLDNLNGVAFVLFYLQVTRGDEYTNRDAVADVLRILAPMAICGFALYVTCLNTSLGMDSALQVHQTLSVCASVFIPLLVGWGIYLRFGTRVILVLGLLYGGLQPFVYSAFITEAFEEFKPPIAMTIAGLKVVWALTTVSVLAICRVVTTKSLVTRAARLVPRQSPISDTFFLHAAAGSRLRMLRKARAHAISLVFVYLLCCILLAWMYRDQLDAFGWSVGCVAAVIELLNLAWKAIESGVGDRSAGGHG